MSSWRTMRARPAPRAARTAISAAAPGRPGEEKVGGVGAGDEQQQADRAEHHQQRRSYRASQAFLQRDETGGTPVRIWPSDARLDASKPSRFSVGALAAHPGTQPPATE